MLRILHTGDLHLGREYKNSPTEAAVRYREARLDALENIIRLSASEECNYLIITGDLFDSHAPSAGLIKTVCEMLERCACPVLVLPGNHDYCQDEDKLWTRFKDCAGTNTILLDECKAYPMDDAVFYACPCGARTCDVNVLPWLKVNRERDTERPNIGVAHGAIEGLSCDREQRYYYMGINELENLGMDLWLIGHTHVPYPTGDIIKNQCIFNAGTHQQTDVADNAEGSVFMIEVAGDKSVTARKVHTGVISFVWQKMKLDHWQDLRGALEDLISHYDAPNTSLRLTLSGIASAGDYADRYHIYEEFQRRFIEFDVRDFDLQPEITAEMIDAETAEGTAENQLLKCYLDEPELLSLALDLVRSCREEGKRK